MDQQALSARYIGHLSSHVPLPTRISYITQMTRMCCVAKKKEEERKKKLEGKIGIFLS